MITVIYDLETTGLNPDNDYIHQIGLIAVGDNNEKLDELLIKVRPPVISESYSYALSVSGTTIDDLKSDEYISEKDAARELAIFLRKYHSDGCNIQLGGYNSAVFDSAFLANFIDRNTAAFCNAYGTSNNWHRLFYHQDLDYMIIANYELRKIRHLMNGHFHLKDIIDVLGIKCDPSKFHGAMYDAEMTYQIKRVFESVHTTSDYELNLELIKSWNNH